MFSRNEVKSALNMVANHISNGTELQGNIKANTDMRIDGKVSGDVHCKEKVVVGKTASIIGNIVSKDLIIEGSVKGNVMIDGLLYLKASAQFEGDVQYDKVVIEEGATIKGSLMPKPANTKLNVAQQANKETAQTA
ncbi:MAG: polymer-forming cytoskeletal protein [Chitinophagales bacterium]|nr:polymer-forming cytoskeletal protein [Chitinophagales bacterium]